MGVTPLDAALAAVAADVAIVAAGRGRLAGGEEFDLAGPGGPLEALTHQLYGRHYCRPQPASGAGEDPARFLETLRAANAVPPRWDGWTLGSGDAAGLTLLGPG